jgi:flagellar basal body P-ring formation protein FlgA
VSSGGPCRTDRDERRFWVRCRAANVPNKAAFAPHLGTSARSPVPRIVGVMHPRRLLSRTTWPLLLAAALGCASAGADAPAGGNLRAVVEGFLRDQAAGLGGTASARLDDAAARSLPPCAAPQPFLPPGASAWGRVLVGVRCAGPRPWVRYLAAHVDVQARYLVAARSMSAGHVVTGEDLAQRTGDLSLLPRTVLAGDARAVGMIVANGIAAGAPLRSDALRGALVIQPGQAVRVELRGAGFAASIDARALTGAAAGAPVQVRTAEGRVLAGTAAAAGLVTLAAPAPSNAPAP